VAFDLFAPVYCIFAIVDDKQVCYVGIFLNQMVSGEEVFEVIKTITRKDSLFHFRILEFLPENTSMQMAKERQEYYLQQYGKGKAAYNFLIGAG